MAEPGQDEEHEVLDPVEERPDDGEKVDREGDGGTDDKGPGDNVTGSAGPRVDRVVTEERIQFIFNVTTQTEEVVVELTQPMNFRSRTTTGMTPTSPGPAATVLLVPLERDGGDCSPSPHRLFSGLVDHWFGDPLPAGLYRFVFQGDGEGRVYLGLDTSPDSTADLVEVQKNGTSTKWRFVEKDLEVDSDEMGHSFRLSYEAKDAVVGLGFRVVHDLTLDDRGMRIEIAQDSKVCAQQYSSTNLWRHSLGGTSPDGTRISVVADAHPGEVALSGSYEALYTDSVAEATALIAYDAGR